MASPSQNVTQLLRAWGAGDEAAGNQVISVVYQELRRLAAYYLKAERTDHTLQPTAMVNELYVRLFAGDPVDWKNRGHFMAVAARQLRHIMVDYARGRNAVKRGGPQLRVPLDEAPQAGIVIDERVLELDLALERLSAMDSRSAQVVEMRYFGGFTEEETGAALGISLATVKRDWEFARAWLLKELG